MQHDTVHVTLACAVPNQLGCSSLLPSKVSARELHQENVKASKFMALTLRLSTCKCQRVDLRRNTLIVHTLITTDCSTDLEGVSPPPLGRTCLPHRKYKVMPRSVRRALMLTKSPPSTTGQGHADNVPIQGNSCKIWVGVRTGLPFMTGH